MIRLTTRQKSILDFIISFSASSGFPPTRSEIAGHFGFASPNAAEDPNDIRVLLALGRIEPESGENGYIKRDMLAQAQPQYQTAVITADHAPVVESSKLTVEEPAPQEAAVVVTNDLVQAEGSGKTTVGDEQQAVRDDVPRQKRQYKRKAA